MTENELLAKIDILDTIIKGILDIKDKRLYDEIRMLLKIKGDKSNGLVFSVYEEFVVYMEESREIAENADEHSEEAFEKADEAAQKAEEALEKAEEALEKAEEIYDGFDDIRSMSRSLESDVIDVSELSKSNEERIEHLERLVDELTEKVYA